jgi:hypothetical protein
MSFEKGHYWSEREKSIRNKAREMGRVVQSRLVEYDVVSGQEPILLTTDTFPESKEYADFRGVLGVHYVNYGKHIYRLLEHERRMGFPGSFQRIGTNVMLIQKSKEDYTGSVNSFLILFRGYPLLSYLPDGGIRYFCPPNNVSLASWVHKFHRYGLETVSSYVVEPKNAIRLSMICCPTSLAIPQFLHSMSPRKPSYLESGPQFYDNVIEPKEREKSVSGTAHIIDRDRAMDDGLGDRD